jgi:hypothetical protein
MSITVTHGDNAYSGPHAEETPEALDPWYRLGFALAESPDRASDI